MSDNLTHSSNNDFPPNKHFHPTPCNDCCDDPQSPQDLQEHLPPPSCIGVVPLPVCADHLPEGELPTTCVFSESSLTLSDLPQLGPLVGLEPIQCFPDAGAEGEAALTLPPDAAVPVDMTYTTEGHQLVVATPTPAAQVTHTRVRDRKKKCKSVYKHVPHREKPPHLVARRNARERRRVQSVNVAFTRLRRDLLTHNTATHINNNCSTRHLEPINNCSMLQHNSENTSFNNCTVMHPSTEISNTYLSVHPPGVQDDSRHHYQQQQLAYTSDDTVEWSDQEEVGERQYFSDCISPGVMAGY
ncbi:hypothetical protein Hamer_G003342 [Homarus americanus]|uniref:BHLH domain-containing protein n=1 Tax=Homarus americanus TaxID=6706 RepID=A0A8J5N731_HOMAM|nr:hypothetical protein Hamer_G003342 [Homarus americanus]